METEKKGVVIKSTGRWCEVLAEDNEQYICSVKGKFRIKGLRSTNPVAVGDKVTFSVGEDHGQIKTIDPRRNYIVRKSVNLSKQIHIIACNIDMCFLMVTVSNPPTSTGFIDRFLASAEAYKVPVTIIINKLDLVEDETIINEWEQVYNTIGYPVIKSNLHTSKGLNEIKSAMTDKINMLSGHSGVGKTTLINTLQPKLELKTAEVSKYHEKGQHTTTFAEMYPLSFGGFLIDTPGIKGFGLVDIDPDNLGHYFKEIFKYLPACKFHNCKHINEPECAVKEAVEQGEIAQFRYDNYVNIYNSMQEDDNYRIDPYK